MPAGAVSTGYWDSLDRHTDLSEIWMSHPIVRRRINLRISGDQDLWPTVWLGRRLRDRLPLQRTASIGCGIGNFERDVVGQGLVKQIVGVDASTACVAEATELARKAGIESRAAYHCGDAREWLRSATALDAVFFHQSLHHFDRLDELLSLVASALRPDEKHFDILERRDYGGNLVSVIYPNLRRPNEFPASPRDEFDRAIEFLLDLEEWCLRHPWLTNARPYYTAVIAVPRTTTLVA